MLLPSDWFHIPVSNHIQYARIRSHILESYLRCMCVSLWVYLSTLWGMELFIEVLYNLFNYIERGVLVTFECVLILSHKQLY